MRWPKLTLGSLGGVLWLKRISCDRHHGEFGLIHYSREHPLKKGGMRQGLSHIAQKQIYMYNMHAYAHLLIKRASLEMGVHSIE